MKRSRVNPVSKKRAQKLSVRTSVRKKLLEDNPWCEARIDGCSRVATEVHEVLSRARGGNYWDDTDNMLCLCSLCHRFITEHPEWATEHGFIIHAWATPADKRAARRARNIFCYGADIDD